MMLNAGNSVEIENAISEHLFTANFLKQLQETHATQENMRNHTGLRVVSPEMNSPGP